MQAIAPQTRRTHDLVLQNPRLDRQTFRYTLPPGMTFTHVPDAVSFDAKHGSFSLDVSVEGREAKVTTELRIVTQRIPAAEYGDFRDFLRRVDKAMGQAFEAGAQQ